ncbi:MAG: hypothetical protein IKV16_02815 [Clostridia bacterium]|nr:hypothetical protein [Clostridia bacterium]
MRKILGFIILSLISLVCAFSILSCDDEPRHEAVCTNHTDADLNGKCDGCGEDVELKLPDNESCTDCSDLDADGKCDGCGRDVEPPVPPTCEHKDEGYDGKCDLCAVEMDDRLSLISLGKTDFNIVFAPSFDGESVLRIKKLA